MRQAPHKLGTALETGALSIGPEAWLASRYNEEPNLLYHFVAGLTLPSSKFPGALARRRQRRKHANVRSSWWCAICVHFRGLLVTWPIPWQARLTCAVLQSTFDKAHRSSMAGLPGITHMHEPWRNEALSLDPTQQITSCKTCSQSHYATHTCTHPRGALKGTIHSTPMAGRPVLTHAPLLTSLYKFSDTLTHVLSHSRHFSVF